MKNINSKGKIAALAAAAVAAVGIGGYALTHKNMTGASWEEIQAYQTQHPNTTVTYTIQIDDTLTVKQNTEAVTITSPAQVDALASYSDYLQGVTLMQFSELPMTGDMYAVLTEHFPNAQLEYQAVTVLNRDYPVDTTIVPLPNLTAADAPEAAKALKALPQLREVDLLGKEEVSTVSLDTIALLGEIAPDFTYKYATELFGQIISTDMETVEYFQVEIGDKGLEEFKKLLPIMHKLTYFKLDWCETSNEAMAELRDQYQDRFKVVWRVFFGGHNLPTDSYKLWATWSLTDPDIVNFKYFTEVKYLDLGHNYFSHVDFLNYMPDVETCIIACGKLEDISGLANCKKITYLEMLDNHRLDNDDMQVLAQLPNIEHLNLSNMSNITDLSFTDNMTNLKRFWCVQFHGPQAELNRVKELHPDTKLVLSKGGESVSHGWRFLDGNGTKAPAYALISAQFDYTHYDFARYPRGYLREEITYESLGIDPNA